MCHVLLSTLWTMYTRLFFVFKGQGDLGRRLLESHLLDESLEL